MFSEGDAHQTKLPRDNITTVGTWTVRTLYQWRKLRELTHALESTNWDIIGLPETRHKRCGETTTEEGHSFWFCGDDARQQQWSGRASSWTWPESSRSSAGPPVSNIIITIRSSALPKYIYSDRSNICHDINVWRRSRGRVGAQARCDDNYHSGS